MDANKCKEFFSKLFNKPVEVSFDKKCHNAIVMTFTDGLPNVAHNVSCNQCIVKVEGQDPFYFPLDPPHRAVSGWDYIVKLVNDSKDFHMDDGLKERLLKLKAENLEQFKSDITAMAASMGMPLSLVESKLP